MMKLLSELNTPLARRLSGMMGLILALAIAVLSVLPGDELPDVHFSDKLQHAIAYAALSGCVCFWLGRSRLWTGVLIAVSYGVLLEVVQALAGTGRTPSILDAGANLIGACLGAGLAWLVAKLADQA